jgi:pyruvate dehydrogenase E2 component (dihydrolipoamide acetyltransferase)
MTDLLMPRLSDSMESGTILSWLKADGEHVSIGEELVEIETDKATVPYAAKTEGILRILVPAGTAVAVGEPIGRVAASDAAAAPSPSPSSAQPVAPPLPVLTAARASDPTAVRARDRTAARAPDPSGALPRATPLARRIAAIHGVDLATVAGTGLGGRIRRSDVAAKAGIETAPSLRVIESEVWSEDGASEIGELTRLEQTVARRVTESKSSIPHFQIQTDAEIDAVLALRERLRRDCDGASLAVPTINDFMVRATALALRAHPRANASYRDGHLEFHRHVHVGLAVAREDALLVATVRDADRLALGALAAESRRLIERVRDATIAPDALSGATCTVSNLGMFGATAIYPIINPGQAVILGVGAARPVPALRDGKLVERRLVTLTVSCDHRVLYGADAARFLQSIKELLERPGRLLL